jgi:two-component system, cell cycle sensor histidine kinase PleC
MKLLNFPSYPEGLFLPFQEIYMFGYIRFFSILSLLVVLILAAVVGVYLRTFVSGDLRDMGEHTNVIAAQGFSSSIWREHRSNVLLYLQGSPDTSEEALQNFVQTASSYVSAAQLQHFTVYDKQGNPIFTVNTADVSPKEDIIKTVSYFSYGKGKVSSELKDAAGNLPGKTVRSFVPLYNTQGVEAILEINTEVTPMWRKVMILQWVISGGMIMLCIVLFTILMVASKKAEAIISKQYEVNVELEAAATAARAETQQKSMFLANISHELRTPLNAIIGFSDIIKNELAPESQFSRFATYITDIHQAGVHLLSLINDILDFSKADANKLELEVSEVNASKLVANCLRLVSPRAEDAGVILEDAMPKESIVLTTDNKRLKQVLLNLLSNAVKFTPSGGKVRVTAWRDLATDSIGFEVRDTGIGIAAKDISKAMTPFGQVDNALSRKYEGTGLGLPMAKKFVELMGGTFTIASEVNVGTTITILLPATFKDLGNSLVKFLE